MDQDDTGEGRTQSSLKQVRFMPGTRHFRKKVEAVQVSAVWSRQVSIRSKCIQSLMLQTFNPKQKTKRKFLDNTPSLPRLVRERPNKDSSGP
jgi:hypothetical protein